MNGKIYKGKLGDVDKKLGSTIHESGVFQKNTIKECGTPGSPCSGYDNTCTNGGVCLPDPYPRG